MPSVTTKLEFSVDPLSDTTPAWTNITQYCQAASWSGGVTKDTDSPQAGGATFTLKNLQRRFEPEYAAGAYYPNIVPGRRFRITITADGVNYTQGIYYAREWKVEYPDPSLGYSVVTVACSDGFWRLATDTLPAMSPPSAESFEDVAAYDVPFAHYAVNEQGGKVMTAIAGPEGRYSNFGTSEAPLFGYDSALLGDNAPGILFTTGNGRALLEDSQIWNDTNQVTLECTVNRTSGAGGSRLFCAGPYDTAASGWSFGIDETEVFIKNAGGTSVLATHTGGGIGIGTFHLALVYDGSTVTAYKNGVATATASGSGNIISPDTPEYVYVGGSASHGASTGATDIVSQVVFYDHALSASRIAAHATAALSRGYNPQTSGTRVAAVAADPLWSTAGIPAGTVTVAGVTQHGQNAIDEINAAASTESPGSLFYFNDAGNPAYETLMDTWTSAATFGDTGSEVRYQSIDLAYDDDLVNTATVSGPNLLGATASNTQSLADYGNRGVDQTSLPIKYQTDAALLAQAYVDRFSTPMFRCESITLNGQDAAGRLQILTREIGDVIRVRRREGGGTPIDVVTRILGKSKSVDVHGNIICTWSLARGFNATTTLWHLGVTGFSELGQTTVLG